MDKNKEKVYDHTFNFYNYNDGWTQVHSIQDTAEMFYVKTKEWENYVVIRNKLKLIKIPVADLLLNNELKDAKIIDYESGDFGQKTKGYPEICFTHQEENRISVLTNTQLYTVVRTTIT